jgi:hypothetical protein
LYSPLSRFGEAGREYYWRSIGSRNKTVRLEMINGKQLYRPAKRERRSILLLEKESEFF